MKLVFAAGEHAPVMLVEETVVIGAGADADVVLAQPGIAPRHAQIERQGARVQLVPCAEPVKLNGRVLHNSIVIKPGDTLEFAGVRCRVVSTAADAPHNEDRSTRMRDALPRYVLRGVSGPTFGRSFGVSGTLTMGRQSDCDVCIPIGEISRRHAQVKPGNDGVLVEDLDSANGTYINGKRVRTGTLHPGQELALDTVRFLLLAPGADATAGAAAATRERRSHGVRIAALVVLVVLIALLIAHEMGVF